MGKTIKNSKDLLEYIDRTSKKIIHSKISDTKGNKDFWRTWNNEMRKREEVACYEVEDLFSDDGYVESEERTVRELIN